MADTPHAATLAELGISPKTVIRAQTGRDAAAIGALSVDGTSGHWVNDQETVMRAVTMVIAALGVLGVVTASGPARAHDDNDNGDWRRQEWQEHHWRERRWREHEWRERAWHTYAPPPIAYAPPGYYTSQPTYDAPPSPAYYAVPPGAYYAPAPPPVAYQAPGVSIGFGFR